MILAESVEYDCGDLLKVTDVFELKTVLKVAHNCVYSRSKRVHMFARA